MNTLKIYFYLLISISFFTFPSCGGDDDPVIPNEEELITTLNYILTPISGGSAVTLVFQDLDGDGGNPPNITGGTLTANTSYNGALQLLNDAATPAVDISAEISNEQEDHQFFFSSTLSDLTVNYEDTDADGKPVGLATTLMTGAAGTGSLTIVLRHEPEKSASGVAEGDISNAGGETDIEVPFDIIVQ